MIGIDITHLDRFAKIGQEEFLYFEKFFSQKEWDFAFQASFPAERLAVIFSLKEAVMKAVGGDIMKRYDRVEVAHEASGKPIVSLAGHEGGVEVSVSHDGGMVVAVAFQK